MYKNSIIYSLSANEELTKEVAKLVGIKIGNCEVMHFADGEILVENYTTVRGKDVYIIQSTCTPATERLMELLIFVDSLKRASAKSITVVVPYYGYSRQDRKAKPRQPITSKLVANLLYTAGVHRVITVELHAAQIQGFFDCLVDELTAIPLLAKYFKDKVTPNTVIVSPDHGGVNRARRFAERLNLPIAIIDKRRVAANVAEVMNIVGDVEGKDCLMVDDMIDTAGSCSAGAKLLKTKGARTVSIACTHGVFSGPAAERLLDGTFDEVCCTNSIPLPEKMKHEKVTVLSLAPMIASVIDHIENGEAVSLVYDVYNLY